MAHDQERFLSLVEHKDLNPKIKTHTLSCSMQIASSFRNIETVKFLIKNGVELKTLTIIDHEGGLEGNISSIVRVLDGWCNRSFFDQKLIELLFDNGLDFSIKTGRETVYFSILDSAPKEFSIKNA